MLTTVHDLSRLALRSLRHLPRRNGPTRCLSTQTHTDLDISLVRALRREAPIDIHPELQDALANKRPVVALESALITNGMPYPANLTAAKLFEKTVRTTGAIPATIALLGGRVKIGLTESELEKLAEAQHTNSAVKVSRRDIAAAISQRCDGGTTCAATLIFASLAGIKVFSTGGLGGVHRGAETTMDVSADLHELARCPVGLVSGGVKSILDIGRTLEYLETLGVPVVTYGTTKDFPAFYSGRSGFSSPWNVNDPKSAADLLMNHWRLGLQNGCLIAAPMPDEYMDDGLEIQAAVEQAICESEENGMSKRGKEVTPWLLARVTELTGGKSLRNNVHLIENTCKIGGEIAVEYVKLQDKSRPDSTNASAQVLPLPSSRTSSPNKPNAAHQNPHPHQSAELIIVGASAVDITAQSTAVDPGTITHSTTPGAVKFTPGGVGRNVAEAAHYILSSGLMGRSESTMLVSPIGTDAPAAVLLAEHSRTDMRTDGLLIDEFSRTAVCNMLLDSSGSLLGGVADMDILRGHNVEPILKRLREHKPKLVAFDGNYSSEILAEIVDHCNTASIPTLFEPTSIVKSVSIFPVIVKQTKKMTTKNAPITYTSPNLLELSQMYRAASDEMYNLFDDSWWEVMNDFNVGNEWRMALNELAAQPACPTMPKGTLAFISSDGIAQMAVSLLPYFQHIIVKCGDRGIILVARIIGAATRNWDNERSNPYGRYIVAKGLGGDTSVVLKHFPAVALDNTNIVSVTGAGDTLVGALCAGLVRNPQALQDPRQCAALVLFAQEAATLSLQSERAVSPLVRAMVLPTVNIEA